MADYLSLSAQLAALGVLSAWSLKCSIRGDFSWLFRMLGGAFICYFLCTLFIIIHLLSIGGWPGSFSSSDFCLLGLYGFFLSADLGLLGVQTQAERGVTNRYRAVALLAPLVVVAFHIAYLNIYVIGYPYEFEGWVNNTSYGLFLSLTGYWSLRLYLAARKGVQAPFLRYHFARLVYLMLELTLFLVSSLGWDGAYYVVLYLEIPALFFLFLSAKKGATR